MKKSLIHILLIAAVVTIVQWAVSSYLIMVVIWVVTGAFFAFVKGSQKIFLKGLLGGLIASLVLWFFLLDNSAWPLENMMSAAGINGVWLLLIFFLFTMLNTAFCLLAGHSFMRILKPR